MQKNSYLNKLNSLSSKAQRALLIAVVTGVILASFLLTYKGDEPTLGCNSAKAQSENEDCLPAEQLPSGAPISNLSCNPGLNQQCRKVGINFATGPTGNDQVDRADRLNMGYILIIGSSQGQVDQVAGNFNHALDRGITPILRICIGRDQCDFHSAQTYKNFLIDLSARVGNRPFYAIAGPNEPLTEVWLGGQEGDPRSVGPLVAGYMNQIINLYNQERGGSQVRLISPVFNATNPLELEMIDVMSASGANWGGLEGIALNTYNITNGSTTGFLNSLKAKGINQGKPYFITETGMYEISQGVESNTAKARMKAELDLLKNDGEVAAMLFFNSFGNNTSPQFQYNVLTDTEWANLLTYECVEMAKVC